MSFIVLLLLIWLTPCRKTSEIRCFCTCWGGGAREVPEGPRHTHVSETRNDNALVYVLTAGVLIGQYYTHRYKAECIIVKEQVHIRERD